MLNKFLLYIQPIFVTKSLKSAFFMNKLAAEHTAESQAPFTAGRSGYFCFIFYWCSFNITPNYGEGYPGTARPKIHRTFTVHRKYICFAYGSGGES